MSIHVISLCRLFYGHKDSALGKVFNKEGEEKGFVCEKEVDLLKLMPDAVLLQIKNDLPN